MGAIAGGVAGGVVGLLLLAAVGILLAKLRGQGQSGARMEESGEGGGGGQGEKPSREPALPNVGPLHSEYGPGAGVGAAGFGGGGGVGENPFVPDTHMHSAPGSGSVPGGVYHGGFNPAHGGAAGYGQDQSVGGYYPGDQGVQAIQPLPQHISYAPQASGQQYSPAPNYDYPPGQPYAGPGYGSSSGTNTGAGIGPDQGVGGYYPGEQGMQPFLQPASYGPQAAAGSGAGAFYPPGHQYSPPPNSGSGSGIGTGGGTPPTDPRSSGFSDGKGTGTTAGTSLPYATQDESYSPPGASGLAGVGTARRRSEKDGAGSPPPQGFYGFPEVQS